jgi:hypothetical protein
LPKKIFQKRPDIILNIDNEYMTFMLMDEIRRFYVNSGIDMPQRHYFHRFVRDFRQWTQKYVDFAHFTVPMQVETSDGFKFPSEFVGQYGSFEALKHIYSKTPALAGLVKEDSLFVSDKYFAPDLEKGIQKIRSEWRAANGIADDATVIFVAPGNEHAEAEFSTE